MHALVNIAIKAARNAGKIILRSFDRLDTLTISEKSFNDFVTEVDKAAEEEIIRTIQESYPNHAFLGEESGTSGQSDFVWIIDPLDGTTNYIHGLPCFAVSIGVKYKGKLTHGVIYDPLNGELFTATRGEGAYLNNRRIRVSSRTNLNGSLLSIGFPYKKREDMPMQLAILNKMFPQTAGFRCIGSAALSLAYVAAGRIDAAYWISCLSEWDIAAGLVIIQEAGGLASDLRGGENFETGNLAAGNPKILKSLLQTIQPCLPNN
ncbi:MAG: inositol monophosphatase [Gammaproteobacteria bacterium GWE2_37_16]|nr:MAG: inositol monophosphatase [Gammaproteobacteria bacterium GWE2_37_16]